MKPDEITKEQLYKLLHVSKRKAKWMLDKGIIPCVNRGTKTHTYLIRMEDVRIYLARPDAERQRELPDSSTHTRSEAVENVKISRRGNCGREKQMIICCVWKKNGRSCRTISVSHRWSA